MIGISLRTPSYTSINNIASVSSPCPDTTLLRARRLPKLNAVSFRIHDPAEPPIIILLDAVINLNSFFAKLRKQAIEVFHSIIDHERRLARLEIFRVFWKGGPDHATFSFRSI